MALFTKCTGEILNAKYEAADFPKVVAENCSHLPTSQEVTLLILLEDYAGYLMEH